MTSKQTRPSGHVYKFWLDYDDESETWYVSDTEFRGISLEHADPVRLIERVRVAVLDLIECNNEGKDEAAQMSPDSVKLLPIFNHGIEIARTKTESEGMGDGDAIVEIFREIGLTEEEREAIFGGLGRLT